MAMAKGLAVSGHGAGRAGLSGGGSGPVNGGTMPVDRPAARAVTVPAAGLPPGPAARPGRLSRPNAGRNSHAANQLGRLPG
jgi:hypothetical protein